MAHHVEFTLRKFPETGRLKDDCGLPFSCVFQPYAKVEKDLQLVPHSDLGRCRYCYAYVNGYCSFDPTGWVCSLCNRHNEFRGDHFQRYNVRPGLRSSLPEIRYDLYEALCESDTAATKRLMGGSSPVPIYIALIDTAAEEEFLELANSALLAALEALPPEALFGIISFSNKVGLHDIRGATPVVRYVPLFDSLALPLPLSDAVPLADLLCPVGTAKEAIAAALDGLRPDPSFVQEENWGDGQAAVSAAGTSGQEGQGNAGVLPAAPILAVPPSMDRRRRRGVRALGPALRAIMEYLKALHVPNPVADAAAAKGSVPVGSGTLGVAPQLVGFPRLLVLLSGPPDLGAGRLPRARLPSTAGAGPTPDQRMQAPTANGASAGAAAVGGGVDHQEVHTALSAARQFYEQAAVAAASLGVCVDIFVAGVRHAGLAQLEPLANSTGGALFLYPSLEEAAMPQDLYRRLSVPHARAGLLRLRLSRELRAARLYGRLFPDPAHEGLYHIIAADATDTFAADIEHISAAGLSLPDAVAPTLQIAFQYSAVTQRRGEVPPPASSDGDGADAGNAAGSPKNGGTQFEVQRRLRVLTIRVHTARSAAELYSHVNTEAVICVLAHKLLRAVKMEGVAQGRALLRDWLVAVMAHVHAHANPGVPPLTLADLPVDIALTSAEALAQLPRYVYALLRSPLLAHGGALAGADVTAFLHHLWSCLPPAELCRSIYPCLTSYTDHDHQAYPRHSLSRAALEVAGAPLWLLDAHVLLLVYCTASAPPSLPFPPPQQCALRRHVAALRAERRVTPHTRFIKEGTHDTTIFRSLLMDDPDEEEVQEGDSGASPGAGLVGFLDALHREVAAVLRADAAAR